MGQNGNRVSAPPRDDHFAQLQPGPHLQEGPHSHVLAAGTEAAAQVQAGAQLHGLQLQVSVIENSIRSLVEFTR